MLCALAVVRNTQSPLIDLVIMASHDSDLEPAVEETAAICERMRELGVIVQPTGDRQNVLKMKPPMCITRESADFFVDMLERVLRTGWWPRARVGNGAFQAWRTSQSRWARTNAASTAAQCPGT